MGNRQLGSLIGTTAVLAILSACTATPAASPPALAPPPSPEASGPTARLRTVITASRADVAAPRDVRPTPGRFSCGEVVLLPAGTLPHAERACLESHIGRSAAELVVIQRTTEGDPVISYYLTSPALHGYDLTTDQTRDRFGDQRWLQERCRPTSTIDQTKNSCTQRS